MRLTRISQLTIDDITETDGDSYLVIDRHPVLLPPPVVQLLREAGSTPSPSALSRSRSGAAWLFPGRSPGRPMPPLSMSKRLRATIAGGRSRGPTASTRERFATPPSSLSPPTFRPRSWPTFSACP
jgi:hypothetical protein